MIKIAQEDGTFLKIHRRRKRKTTSRKRGRPRKQVEIPSLPPSKKRPYNIILTSLGRQKECIKTFRTQEDAYVYFQKLLNENKNVKFPIRHLNYNKIIEAKYELYIIKRIDENETKTTTHLRNDYGELVEYSTNLENWQVIDKAPWNIEESFWVFGYDPLYQRKNFEWIIDNFIIDKDFNPYSFKNILVYQNKLLIDHDGDLKIVFCKCVEDSFRLYTEIEEYCQNNKLKNIMFSGNIRDFSRATITAWLDRLCEVTGFTRKKIKRNSLRP